MKRRPSSRKIAVTLLSGLMLCAGTPAWANSQEASQLIDNGDQLVRQGQYEDAIKAFQQALSLTPQSAELHNKLGLCYSREQRLPEAVDEYRKALQCDPQFAMAAHNLGSAMYRKGDYSAAIDYYHQAIALSQNQDLESMINLAQVYRDRATLIGGVTRDIDIQKSLDYFQKALKVNPDSPVAHNNLGLLYLRIRRFDEAAAEIHKALALKDDYAEAYFNLGLIEEARNKTQAAVAAFQNSLRYETNDAYRQGTQQKIDALSHPQEASDPFTTGVSLLHQERWTEAEAAFRLCVSGNSPGTAVAWNNLGLALAQQGRTQDAIDAYRKATELQPAHFPEAQYNLGQAYLHGGDLSGAEQALRRAITQSGGSHALAHNALGMVLRMKGQAKAAQAEYRLAILQSGDKLPVVHFNLGMLLAEQSGRAQDAMVELKRYIGQAPNGINVSTANQKLHSLEATKK